MCFVNAPEHDVGSKCRPLRDLSPFTIPQMLGIDTHNVLYLTFFDLIDKIPASFACFRVCRGLFVVRKRGHLQLFELLNLENVSGEG